MASGDDEILVSKRRERRGMYGAGVRFEIRLRESAGRELAGAGRWTLSDVGRRMLDEAEGGSRRSSTTLGFRDGQDRLVTGSDYMYVP